MMGTGGDDSSNWISMGVVFGGGYVWEFVVREKSCFVNVSMERKGYDLTEEITELSV